MGSVACRAKRLVPRQAEKDSRRWSRSASSSTGRSVRTAPGPHRGLSSTPTRPSSSYPLGTTAGGVHACGASHSISEAGKMIVADKTLALGIHLPCEHQGIPTCLPRSTKLPTRRATCLGSFRPSATLVHRQSTSEAASRLHAPSRPSSPVDTYAPLRRRWGPCEPCEAAVETQRTPAVAPENGRSVS